MVREAAGGVLCKLSRVILRPASIWVVIVGITLESSVRILKTATGIFLREFLKENYDRLWDIFGSRSRGKDAC